MNHKGPSPHLSWKEMACKDGTPYPAEWKSTRAVHLSRLFESIRTACGNKPIAVVSAYRTPIWNFKVGGAKDSQHLHGRALDLRPPAGMSVTEFYNLIRKIGPQNGMRGLGLYKTFVHVDIRPTEQLVLWSGKGVKDDRPAN